jgi:hypothetical protein
VVDFSLADVIGERGPGDGGAFQFGEGRVEEDAVEVSVSADAGGEVGEGGGYGGVDLVGDGEVRVVGHVLGVLV